MNKNLIIAFLIGIIVAFSLMTYFPNANNQKEISNTEALLDKNEGELKPNINKKNIEENNTQKAEEPLKLFFKFVEEYGEYSGEIKNGKPHGYGVIIFSNGCGDDPRCEFSGFFKNGEPNGNGLLINQDGKTIFEGSLTGDQVSDGYAILNINSVSYKGTFKDGLPNGQGEMTYKDGTVYKGTFKNNKRHGQGEILFTNGNSYKGSYINDLYDGKGIFFWKNEGMYGSEYRGDFKKGKKHGFGEYHEFIKDGGSYVSSGIWENDVFLYSQTSRSGKYDSMDKFCKRQGVSRGMRGSSPNSTAWDYYNDSNAEYQNCMERNKCFSPNNCG